jgi:hypothetical protein
MIPRELYGVNDNESNNVDNSKYYKHRKVPLAPDEKKQASKRKLQITYGSDNITEVSHQDEDADDAMDEHTLMHVVNSNDSDIVAETETPTALDDLRHRLQVDRKPYIVTPFVLFG